MTLAGATLALLVLFVLEGAWQDKSSYPLKDWLVGASLALIVWWLLVSFLGPRLLERTFSVAGPFVFVTSALVTASSILERSQERLWLEDSLRHRLQSARTRRRLRSTLKDAEHNLSRLNCPGPLLQDPGRSGVGTGLGDASRPPWATWKVLLELERERAVPRALALIDEVWCLTMLRDWSVDNLTTMEEVEHSYQAPVARAIAVIWRPVPVLALVLALIGSAQPLWDWASARL